jgi:hypothetical protein
MSFRKPPSTAFKPGNPGGPGRPRGARSKLNELAVALLHEDFAKHGAEVIKRVRERKPEVYLASVVSLLPKQSQIEKRSPFDDVSDEELQMLEEHLTALRARLVSKLELLESNGAADCADADEGESECNNNSDSGSRDGAAHGVPHPLYGMRQCKYDSRALSNLPVTGVTGAPGFLQVPGRSCTRGNRSR